MSNGISWWFWLAFAMTTDGEYSLMYLLPFVHLYFQKRLFFIHFFKTRIFDFCFCVVRVLQIFWPQVPYQIYDLQIFLLSVSSLFTFFMFFWSIKAFNFDKVQCTYFSFYCLGFQCYIIESTAKSRSWRFSSKVFIQF